VDEGSLLIGGSHRIHAGEERFSAPKRFALQVSAASAADALRLSGHDWPLRILWHSQHVVRQQSE
jgi:hypothetical protein